MMIAKVNINGKKLDNVKRIRTKCIFNSFQSLIKYTYLLQCRRTHFRFFNPSSAVNSCILHNSSF